jgi:hypothetical protein
MQSIKTHLLACDYKEEPIFLVVTNRKIDRNGTLMCLQESERCAVHHNNIYITRAECDWDVAALEDNC